MGRDLGESQPIFRRHYTPRPRIWLLPDLSDAALNGRASPPPTPAFSAVCWIFAVSATCPPPSPAACVGLAVAAPPPMPEAVEKPPPVAVIAGAEARVASETEPPPIPEDPAARSVEPPPMP